MTRQEITEFYQEHHRRLYNISLLILRDADEAAPVPVWTKIRQFLRPAPVIAFALATLAAAFLIIRPGDPFRGAGNDPEAIYLAYMDRVSRLYQTLPCEDSELRDATLAEITEEEEPLFTQLPEELSDRERGRILRNHYGRILAAAGQIK